jgi:protein-S-isoprenylcysteine O-methyltransferase Ste14
MVFRSRRLAGAVRRRPMIGVLLSVVLLVLCVVELVLAPNYRSTWTGPLPMWLVSIVGIVLFGAAAIVFFQRARAQHTDD